MKKVVSLIIILALCLGIAVPAMAAGTTVTLPEETDIPEVTAVLNNVLATTDITVSEFYYDNEIGDMAWRDKTITVYTLPTTGAYVSITAEADAMLFPGGYGGYRLIDGKYSTPMEEFGFEGQLFSVMGPETVDYSLDTENPENTDIFHLYICGGLSVYFTFADLSAYANGSTEAPAEPEVPAAPSFNDVPADAYFAQPVQWAVENAITDGTSDTTFSPDNTCTNAQILTFLWRAVGCPEPTAAAEFDNLSGSEYYYKAALWAKENGLVDGAAFESDIPCTRSMTVTYQWKLAGKPAAEASGFADVDSSAEYAAAVAWAVAEGITDGTSDTSFSPDATCTRGQIVTFLWRDLA